MFKGVKTINIKSKGHTRADPENDGITFTVIRNPIERFESLINYRLNESKPRCVIYVYNIYIYIYT